MKISDFGVNFLVQSEGFKDHVYTDQVGKSTIGYGHLVRVGEVFPPRISILDAKALFRKDIAWVEDAVNRQITYPCTQRQFDMLCSLTFNTGAAGLARTGVPAKLNAGDVGAADRGPDGKRVYTGALLAWSTIIHGEDEATKRMVVVPALVQRRALEISIFAEELRLRIGVTENAPDLRDAHLRAADGDDEPPPDGAA